jgi:hypothetical protein
MGGQANLEVQSNLFFSRILSVKNSFFLFHNLAEIQSKYQKHQFDILTSSGLRLKKKSWAKFLSSIRTILTVNDKS